MKKIAYFACLLLVSGTLLTSCNTNVEEGPDFEDAQLRAGTWIVDHVEANNFDSYGNLVSTQTIRFGEGQPGGICTFDYADGKFTMVDNGRVFESSYNIDGRVIYTDDGGQWGLRQISDTKLEMVLRGEELRNPCDYSVAGAVYFLNRTER